MKLIYTRHALEQLIERNITKTEVEKVVQMPDKIIEEDSRIIYQKTFEKHNWRYLTRVITMRGDNKIKILTMYRTTKISKYL